MLNTLNILLIGSGAREHAIADAISRSPMCKSLYCSPGNPGIANIAHIVQLDEKNHDSVIAFCKRTGIDLVMIGPEAPLVDGLADRLRQADIATFGPSKAAAQLEGSKAFTKELCVEASIPTAAYGHFHDEASALAYLKTHKAPIVVKADGLAAGKGVTVATTDEEAEQAVRDCFNGVFGAAGAEVVIEEFMEGEEASFFALCDGTHVVALTSAQDHKRAFDGDKGPNTGGMGAYSPAPCLTPQLEAEVMRRIIHPTVEALCTRGTPYIGVLYAGLMLTKEGPKLIEYNCRFGDPETEVIIPRLANDFVEMIYTTAIGQLKEYQIKWHNTHALCVVYANEGYPTSVTTGSIIKGVDTAVQNDDCKIYHASTKLQPDGQLIANGGRVLCVVGTAETLSEARDKAYDTIQKIDWPEGFYRNDIGWRAMNDCPPVQ